MVIKEIPVPVIPGLENVYFPSFPYPKDGIVLPLDENKNVITGNEPDADDITVDAVLMPYWYWKLIINYVTETEEAVTALTAAKPP